MKTLDAGQAETNKLIEKVEKRVNKEYSQATKDMQKKLNDYLKSFESKDKAMQKQLADGLITEKQYKDWRFGQIMTGKRWQEQLDVLSKDLENSRQIAMNIVSGELPSAFAIGHNYGTYLIESGTSLNTSYTLYNRDTVSKLIKDRPKLLPDPTKGSKTEQALKSKQIQRWSKAKMTSAIAQGVLQGESIPKIASRLRNVTNMSYRASIRNARTMLTSSENLGRQASFERAQDMGIEMEKQWLATLDDRTRDSHALMDGERVPLDENFSNGLEYPADPSGEPEEIYNCRCTMVTAIKGFEKALTDFDLSENEKLHGMSYDEWKESHLHEPSADDAAEEVSEKFEVVNGENIFGTWERREDEFDFEIEDVINAQGFDGLPRVVSAEEFDKAVQESNFIAQRTYSAPSQKILDEYRDQLYNGKWYVDCSTGGAEFGQGMYCAADYSGVLSDGIRKEMKRYTPRDISEADLSVIAKSQKAKANEVLRQYKAGEISREEGVALYKNINSMQPNEYLATYMKESEIKGSRSYVETFTLDPSAKTISYKDAMKMKGNAIDEEMEKYRKFNANSTQIVEDAQRKYIESLELTADQKKVLLSNYEIEFYGESRKDMLARLSDAEREQVVQIAKSGEIRNIAQDVQHQGEKLRENASRIMDMDLGSYTASKGYDAINVEGRGSSGSYTVILNRTKVIFKQP